MTIKQTNKTVFYPLANKILILSLAFSVYACANPKTDANYNRPIDEKSLQSIAVGMDLDDAERILGTPSIRDNFSPNKPIYLFLLNAKPHQVILTIDANNKITNIDSKTR